MAELDHRGPPRRLVEGGDGSAQSELAAKLLRPLRAPAPTSAARERVWAQVRARRSPSRVRWIWAAIPVAAFAITFFILSRQEPSVAPAPRIAPFMLTLASGAVRAGTADLAPVVAGAELPSGSRVRTEVASRAHVRFFDASGLLIREGTEVSLSERVEGALVQLQSGAVVAAVTPQAAGRSFAVIAKDVRVDVEGTLFSVESGEEVAVRVAEGVVSVARAGSRARVLAGQCWTSRTNSVEPCEGPADAGLARALTRPRQDEGRIVIDGDASLDVVADGVALGHPPIQWWTAARALSVSGEGHGARVERSVSVQPRREVRLALALPAASSDALPAPAPAPVVAPVVRHPLSVARPPVSVPEPVEPAVPVPTPSPAAPLPPDASHLYQQAVQLEREGQFARASEIFESLSARGDRFGEQSLFALGHLRLKSLKDPAGALAAFDAYRQRFAAGTFRVDVDLSAVDAALAKGDAPRARAEAEAFLAAHPDSERERSVRRIRADLLREAGDCAAALKDYQHLLEQAPGGPDADDALYFIAVCEARQGNPARAREQLEAYLSRFPKGKHRAEVLQALENPAR